MMINYNQYRHQPFNFIISYFSTFTKREKELVMKKSVKLSALCLCAIMLFALASCQGNPANSTATQTAIQTPKDTPSAGESGLISIVQKLRAQNGMSEMTNTQQLNQVAQAIAEAIYAAGEEYRDAGDFSVLPDGTSMTDYLRSKGFSGHYTYSYWFHDYPTKGNTVNMLLNRAEASQDYFINRVTEGGYSSVGAASGIVQDGEYKDFTILVLFFAR